MEITQATEQSLIERVESSLNSIRPYLEADGGNIRVLEVSEDKILKLEFVGNCGTCPMSAMTFKAGVEEAIKRLVPEIRGIEVTNLS
ncbi:MAG: NifU family protein [Cyclobacteriaceae bacterium]